MAVAGGSLDQEPAPIRSLSFRSSDPPKVDPKLIISLIDKLHATGRVDTMSTSSAQGASRRRSSAGAHLSDDAHHSSVRLLLGKLPQVIPCPSLSIS